MTTTAALRSWSLKLQPHRTTVPPAPPKVVGFAVTVPTEWDADKRRISGLIELSLLRHPHFKHLSILPVGSLQAVVEQPNPSRVN